MAEYRQPNFDSYDAKIAEAMTSMNDKAGDGLIGFLAAKFTEFGPGKLVAEMEVKRGFITIMGAIHGGVMAGFVDHIMGCVLYPLMAKGQWAATTEFKLNYLAAVKSGTLVGESRVLSMGKRSAVVQVEVTNGDKLVCIAQGTLLISDPPSKG